MGQYYEQDSFFPRQRSRVQDEFANLDFGGGDYSLDDWTPRSTPEPRRDPMAGFMDSLQGAYGKTPALDTYRSYLSQSPQAEDYRPGKWDRLAAGLAGISTGLKNPAEGVKVAMGMNRSKYDAALKDYYAQAAPLKEAAGIERESQQDRMKTLIDAQKQKQDYLNYARNLSKDEQDYLIATGKLRVDQGQLQLNTDKFGYDKFNDARDYGLDAWKAQHDVNQGYGRLGVDRTNAQTNRMGTESEISRRNFLNLNDAQTTSKLDVVSAGDISRAEQDTLRLMMGDYPKGTIVADPDNGFYVSPTASPETRRIIHEEMAKRANYRAKTGNISFDPEAGSLQDYTPRNQPEPDFRLDTFRPSLYGPSEFQLNQNPATGGGGRRPGSKYGGSRR
jgi:hypothetical protein